MSTHESYVEGEFLDPDNQAMVPTAPVTHAELMPALSIEQASNRYLQLKNFITDQLKDARDFGVVPGTKRVSLYQPGAEKLCTFLGLSPRVRCIESEEDWMGIAHGGEAFFYYRYEYALYRGDVFMGSADASCNSWEPKYRYRAGGLTCPDCNQVTIIKSRPTERYPDGGFWCGPKKGGCSANFKHDDPRLTEQNSERTKNPDPSELVNTIQGMAQKRAYVRVVKMVTNASEYFAYVDPPTADRPSRTNGNGAGNQPTEHTDDRIAAAKDAERRRVVATALAQLVKLDGDKCIVPSVTEANVVHEVSRNASRRLVCNCPDFTSRLAELEFECEHIAATKLYFTKMKAAQAAEPAKSAPEPATKTEPLFTPAELGMEVVNPDDTQKDEMARGISSLAATLITELPDGFTVRMLGYAGDKKAENKVFRDLTTNEPRCTCEAFVTEFQDNPTNTTFRCVHQLAVHHYLLSTAEVSNEQVTQETFEKIRQLAAKACVDPDKECMENLGCNLAELPQSKVAGLIGYLEKIIVEADTPF